MMFEIVGIESINFTSRQTGDQITGTNLFVHYPQENNRPGLQGVRTDKLFVNLPLIAPCFPLGDQVEVYYNRYGKVDSVHLA